MWKRIDIQSRWRSSRRIPWGGRSMWAWMVERAARWRSSWRRPSTPRSNEEDTSLTWCIKQWTSPTPNWTALLPQYFGWVGQISEAIIIRWWYKQIVNLRSLWVCPTQQTQDSRSTSRVQQISSSMLPQTLLSKALSRYFGEECIHYHHNYPTNISSPSSSGEDSQRQERSCPRVSKHPDQVSAQCEPGQAWGCHHPGRRQHCHLKLFQDYHP